MKRHIALLFAAVVSLGSLTEASMALDVVAAPSLKADDSIRTVFAERYARTLVVLKKDFPADYQSLIERIFVIEHSKASEKEKLLAAFVSLSDLQKKYRSEVYNAPDYALRPVIGLLGEFIVEVLKIEGAPACGAFATDGAGVLFDRDIAPRYAERLDAQSEAYFTAVVESIENPTFHTPITEADWLAVGKDMVANGATREDILRIAASDPKDPARCVSLGRFFLFLALNEGDASERLRADFVQNATGY